MRDDDDDGVDDGDGDVQKRQKRGWKKPSGAIRQQKSSSWSKCTTIKRAAVALESKQKRGGSSPLQTPKPA
jgi:hypothetical protein